MKRLLLILAIPLALTACGTPISGVRPIVDLEGVNMVQYNRDLAACETWVASQVFVAGNGTSQCMNDRGYKILRWN